MSREIFESSKQVDNQPTQAVKDEAAHIIRTLDGSPNSQYYIDGKDYDTARAFQVREMLIKDSQTMSPKDMHDLLKTVMNSEDHKHGYDLAIWGHNTAEVRAVQEKIDKERQNLGMLMANCTREERVAAFTQFNKDADKRMEDYKEERVVELTHFSTPGEYGEKGRSYGDPIKVTPYRNANGLPDFNIVSEKLP